MGGPSYDEYVKRPGTELQYTDEQIKEVIRCSNDLVHFASNYIYVVDPIKGLIKWEPRPYQLRILKAYSESRFNIVMAARQVGKSTVSMIYLLWKGMFNDNLDIAVLANKFASAREVLKRIQEAYENLPNWLKPGVTSYNRMSIDFENGSVISAGSTTKESIRGRSISILYLDEFAHVKAGVAREFWTSNYPTISTGGQIIVVSTPNGVGNLFYEIWKAAERAENDFVNTRVDWWEVPGRDEDWKKETIRNLKSIVIFNQEYGNRFIGSSNTLIDYKVLEKLVGAKPIAVHDDDKYHIWEQPIKGETYLIGVDPAEGRGADYHVIQCLNITKIPWVQVARWKDNNISLVDLPGKIYEIARKYNDAYVIIEANGIGTGVASDLFHHLEYGNIARMQKRVEDLGVKATKGTKHEGAGILKKVIENEWCVLKDEETINELMDFGPKQGTYKGLNGNDDLIMALLWCLYFNKSSEFRNMASENYLEYFDFKKGEYVIDNADALHKSLFIDESTPSEMIKHIREVAKTDEQQLLEWLIS